MNRIRNFIVTATLVALVPFCMANQGCETEAAAPASSSGVTKASVKVETGSDNLTVEQRNIAKRLKVDNMPGSVKHLYVISAFSGQVLIYSTVQGKVTSGSKRLSPKTVQAYSNNAGGINGGFDVPIGQYYQRTTEVLGDDGTYGDSGDYLFWFDAAGRFHQQYTQGCVIAISDQPLPVKGVVINMELKKED